MKMHLKLKQLAWMSVVVFGAGLANSYAADLPLVNPSEVGMSSAKLEKVGEIVKHLVATKRLAGASVIVARKGKVCFFEITVEILFIE